MPELPLRKCGKRWLGLMRVFFCSKNYKVADLSPKNICSETIRHRWYLSLDLNIGEFPGFGGLLQGQIDNPELLYNIS